MLKTGLEIRKLDFCFENSLVKIVANRNYQEIQLAGLKVGPFGEGDEYEVQYWIAKEIVKSGIARFRENVTLDATNLHKIQWKERVQTARQTSKLPEDFYPKLRRYLTRLKEEIARKPEKMREDERVRQLTQDIINSRLKKIVSFASAPAQTEQSLRNFTDEERVLYKEIYKLISEWRTKILGNGEGEK
ncbi:DNA replication complex GINS family protein [Candidatus Bathyarchaeota archaeon]|nr:DNA replication complex GINS family protein [Candidatus Bathyarchaeota archaeon]